MGTDNRTERSSEADSFHQSRNRKSKLGGGPALAAQFLFVEEGAAVVVATFFLYKETVA